VSNSLEIGIEPRTEGSLLFGFSDYQGLVRVLFVFPALQSAVLVVLRSFNNESSSSVRLIQVQFYSHL